MKQRGVGLGTVLVVVALLAAAGLAISGVSVTHLNLMAQSTSVKQTENLARSVVAGGIEKVLSDSDHDYGASRLAGESLDIVISGPAGGSTARLTFSPEEAALWGIPYSTNNIHGDRSVEGDGRVVPASALHLYGVAESAGKKRTVEVLLHVPAFPYAVTSAGALEARDGLVVGSLSELPMEGEIPSPSRPEPADIHSNAEGTGAIVLGRDTRIGGDVATVGTIEIMDVPSVNVMGEILNNADLISLPNLNLSDYDPELRVGSFDSYDDGVYTQLEIPGASRSSGDLRVSSGGLHLDGGLLFVEGNLTVAEGLSGKGILVVTGDLIVDGEARVSQDSKLAILTGGDFRLRGGNSRNSYLQGIVYTGGDFFAESATLVGALVSKGGTDLQDARMFLYDTDDPVTVSLGDPEVDVEEVYTTSFNGQLFDVLLKVEGSERVTITISEGGTVIDTVSLLTSYDTALVDMQNAVSGMDISALLAARLSTQLNLFHRQWGELESERGETGEASYAVDPSKFFKLEDKIRVTSWQET